MPKKMPLERERIDPALLGRLDRLPDGYSYECDTLDPTLDFPAAKNITTLIIRDSDGKYIASFVGTGGIDCWIFGYKERMQTEKTNPTDRELLEEIRSRLFHLEERLHNQERWDNRHNPQ